MDTEALVRKMKQKESAYEDKSLVVDIDAAPVPKELEKGWKRLRASRTGPATARAIYRAAIMGETWRDASAAEGCEHKNVYNTAKRYDLAGPTKAQVLDNVGRIARLSGDEIEKRLIESADGLHVRDLQTIHRSATEQLQKEWQQRGEDTGYASMLDRIGKQLSEGGTLELKLTVTPREQAIDVTPES